MEVHFYLPEKYLPDPARQEAWKAGKISTLEPGGKVASAQSWIYQTWLALENRGFPCRLTHVLPEDGILVALTGFLGDDYRPPPGVFFAGVVADYVPHPGAHLHVVQNPAHAKRLWHSAFMPHWPHPNLIPRDPGRGNVFENLCFYGDASNLAPEIKEPRWRETLREKLGVRLVMREADQWHDYHDADAVVAVRSFGKSSHLHKPATKLYNAWLAGVPFLGGMDSAYAGSGRPGIDFLQVAGREELFAAVARLKNDAALRSRLVEAGREAGARFTPEAICVRWTALLGQTIPPLAEDWRRLGGAGKRILSILREGSVWLDRRLRR